MSASNRDPAILRRKSAIGVVCTLAAVLLVIGLIRWFQAQDDSGARDGPTHRAVREELDAAAQNRLSAYGWVDREQGIVHVPLERALELVLREQAGTEPGGG